jgi:hypothetical protein
VALTVVAGVAISGSGSGGDNDGDGDVSAPIIVSISADKSAAKEGDSVIFTITMSEEVTIDTTDGTPTVTFDIGGMGLSLGVLFALSDNNDFLVKLVGSFLCFGL